MHHAAPGRCASLILADTFAVHPDGQGIYDRSVAGSVDMRALAEGRVDVLLAQPARPDVRAEVVETMSRIDPAAYRIAAEAVWLADQSDRVAAIQVPTLVLCGAEDAVTPPALSARLANLIPGTRSPVIGRAGHLSNLEQPETFNLLVANFIRDAEAAS